MPGRSWVSQLLASAHLPPHVHICELCATRMGTATCSAPVLGPEGLVWRHSLSEPYPHVCTSCLSWSSL